MNPLSWITGALGGVWGYIAAALISAALIGSATWYVTHGLDDDKYQKLLVAENAARVTAITIAKDFQQEQDKIALDAAVAEAQAQDALHVKTITIVKKVPEYVTMQQDIDHCPTVGFVRVLAAAGRGLDPAALPLSPGQSDDDCASITLSSLANTLTQVIGQSNQNSEQLNSLIDYIKKQHNIKIEDIP